MTGSVLPFGKYQYEVLNLLGYITALEAAGAHLDMQGRSADFCLYFDNIRLPQTAGVVIGLADLVSTHRSLAANFTSHCHDVHLLPGSGPLSGPSPAGRKL